MYDQKKELVAQRATQLELMPEVSKTKANELLLEVKGLAAKWFRSHVNKNKKRIEKATTGLNDAVISGMGMASGHLVKRSTAVRQYVRPDEDGKGPMRSMWMCRKRAIGGVTFESGVTVWRETLEC
jgi:hypothetical protein